MGNLLLGKQYLKKKQSIFSDISLLFIGPYDDDYFTIITMWKIKCLCIYIHELKSNLEIGSSLGELN